MRENNVRSVSEEGVEKADVNNKGGETGDRLEA